MRPIRTAAPIAALISVLVGLSMLPQAAAARDQQSLPSECAWWVETSLSNTNVLYPDTAAAYWTMPYFTDEAQLIEINGTYLDARYFAIQAYGADAQLFTSPDGDLSALADYQIVPNAGSTNPWDSSGEPGGSWTITMSDTPVPGAANQLPLSPSGQVTPLIPGTPATTAFLMIRVYLPDAGFASLRPFLPEVTITDRLGVVRTLLPCSPADRKVLAESAEGAALIKALRTRIKPPKADCGATCPPDLEFFKVGSGATPFPNANSAYVGALYTPEQGRIVVARAMMPSTSTGESPQVWPGGKQLRYWSICNYVHDAPYPAVVVGSQKKRIVGCTNDTTTALSPGGVATIVLSFPSDYEVIKKRLARLPATTWLPMSPRYGETQELLAFRNMLANPDFDQSATQIPVTGNPQVAQQVMGRYYPDVAMCSVKTFLKKGTSGCLDRAS